MEQLGRLLLGELKALWNFSNEDPISQRTWRRSVAVGLTATLLILVGGFFWAQGLIPGVSGVALASEVRELRVTMEQKQTNLGVSVQTLLVNATRDSIKATLRDRCKAGDANNQAALDSANRDFDNLNDQYRSLTGRDYHVPDCEVILIKSTTP